jgi:hypothetical protein
VRKIIHLFIVLSAITPSWAAYTLDLTLLPYNQLDWEGKGSSNAAAGVAENKIKPKSPIALVQVERDLGESRGVVFRSLVNIPRRALEQNGRQVNQARLQVYQFQLDYRHPIASGRSRAVAGLQAHFETIRRTDLTVAGASVPGEYTTNLDAQGVYLGLEAKPPEHAIAFDYELLFGAYLRTHTNQAVDGGALTRGGGFYHARLGVAGRRQAWRYGVGLMADFHTFHIRGGQQINGAFLSNTQNTLSLEEPRLYLRMGYAF